MGRRFKSQLSTMWHGHGGGHIHLFSKPMSEEEVIVKSDRGQYKNPKAIIQGEESTESLSSCHPDEIHCQPCVADSDLLPIVTPPMLKKVSFSVVQIRCYEQIFGDNPETEYPLSLGWMYNEHGMTVIEPLDNENEGEAAAAISVAEEDEEENVMDFTHTFHSLVLKSRKYLPLSLHERCMRLRLNGYSEKFLRNAERRRRVELALDWASANPPTDMPYPYSSSFFFNYFL